MLVRPILAIALSAMLAGSAVAQTAPAQKPPACTSADHRAFDFWVGRWDVRVYGGGPVMAHSLIENLYAGCAIRENWMPLRGGGGGSLSNYESSDGQWHQTWVDASGSRALFDGGFKDGAMVLTGPWRGSGPKGENGVVRMVYTREPDGGVRQKGDVSIDGGKSWQPSFDFLYTPSKPG